MRCVLRGAAAPAVALLILVLLAGAALAHSRPKNSTPAANSSVAAAPAQLVVDFSEAFVPNQSSLAVSGPAGDAAAGTVSVSNGNSRMTLPLKANLPTGTYTVSYKTLSADDGEAADGSFIFTVGSAPSGGPGTGGLPLDGGWLALLGVALASVGLWLTRRRAVA